MIHYSIRPADLDKHRFEVVCAVDDSSAEQAFRLPSWIPGSYLLREFARNVVAVRATSNGVEVEVDKFDKSGWICRNVAGSLQLLLTVYAFDESVRGAFLDRRRAYFNGPCVFPYPLGRENEPIRLTIHPPADRPAWRVATAMTSSAVDASGFGVYAASNYDDLADHPVEIGEHASVVFTAGSVPHRLVVSGKFDSDLDRVAEDLQRLCEAQILFFGHPPPFDRYDFLALAVANGHGGLEHRSSSSLIFKRDNLPRKGEIGVSPEYQRFLGLCSHEYFHSWHVKQTKPLAFMPYRLDQRNYTRLLWVFEGITTYYQDLFLLRSGLIGAAAFLKRMAETLTAVRRTPGRRVQSIAAASFDAWDVLYKPHAESANISVSYYAKGAVVALALDLTLRSRHDSKLSLDTVVKELWEQFGRKGLGVAEDGFEALAKRLGGAQLGEFFDVAVRGTDDLPLAELFDEFGVSLDMHSSAVAGDKSPISAGEPPVDSVWLGALTRQIACGVELATVLESGPAERAGINSGDVLIALDGLRVDEATLQARLRRYRDRDTVSATVFRADELLHFDVELSRAPLDTCVLKLRDAPRQRARRLRMAWLGI